MRLKHEFNKETHNKNLCERDPEHWFEWLWPVVAVDRDMWSSGRVVAEA